MYELTDYNIIVILTNCVHLLFYTVVTFLYVHLEQTAAVPQG